MERKKQEEVKEVKVNCEYCNDTYEVETVFRDLNGDIQIEIDTCPHCYEEPDDFTGATEGDR